MKNYKKLALALGLLCFSSMAQAQRDTAISLQKDDETVLIISEKGYGDSSVVIEVGKIIIRVDDNNKIKINRNKNGESGDTDITGKPKKDKKIQTMFLAGFSIGGANFIPEKSVPDKFEAAPNSTDVHWYLVSQRYKLASNVSFKWGIDLNWRNYRFNDNIVFKKSQDSGVYGSYIDSNVAYSKNKLMSRYVAIPLMIEFHTTKIRSWKSMGIGLGASFGQLINAKQKLISPQYGKQKFNENYGFSRQRVDLIGSVRIGRVVLYGSYGITPMFRAADVDYATEYTPYSVGLQILGI